ncbi:hypothetical protein LPJ61_006888 [Coemansia biformis]|uniref:Fungal-type protein kinase domain-containing protein n=1 Tax=Coemansia biformis TaxID=1286918 RepID=A0A9W7XRL6_9FUNG|nr:hypothetical protein LPJ61_006888 [Coemansia biformis]
MPLDGAFFEDTTDTILARLPSDVSSHVSTCKLYYAHNRMAMTPIAEPLHRVQSVDEFILVVGDAVNAHKAIFDKCRILHRDISDNNIMFVRKGDKIRGVLIDMDYATTRDDARRDVQPICIGIFPFMSVNNLEREDVQRTEIDDMESVLYILLWYGVWGITAGDRDMTADKESIIDVWSADRSDAATSKRNLMHSPSSMFRILQDVHKPTANLADDATADERKQA